MELLYVVYLVTTLAASLLLLLSRPNLQPAPRPALLPAQNPIITENSEKNTRKLFAAQFIGAKANNKTNKVVPFMKNSPNKKIPHEPPKQMVKTLTGSKKVQESANSKPVGLQPVVKCPKPAETAGKAVLTCRGEISLVSPPGRITALASFPGSGNTWTRHLIQQVVTAPASCASCQMFRRFLCNVRIAQVTGRATGSVYRDSKLACGGFPGESRRDGTVAVVKVHEGGPRGRAQDF